MQIINPFEIEINHNTGLSKDEKTALREKIASLGTEEGDFPHKEFELLQKYGFLNSVLPEEYGGNSAEICGGITAILQNLMTIGSIDLSLGRLYEGHLNALLLIDLYGSKSQQSTYFEDAAAGHIFGIWNTDLPPSPVQLTEDKLGFILTGKKIFCSGGLSIQRPIITAHAGGKVQMLVIHTEDLDSNSEDRKSWNPLGMKSSRSFTIDFYGYSPNSIQYLGKPDKYMREPHFSTGAARFAAVQLGGAQAIARAAFAHLLKLGRNEDAIQKQRMGKITLLLESGCNWIRETGRILDNQSYSDASKINYANMTRTAILEICTQIMHHAEKAVGLMGMMGGHNLERLHRDLTTYLKQPGPDLALAKIGEWASESANWDGVYD